LSHHPLAKIVIDQRYFIKKEERNKV